MAPATSSARRLSAAPERREPPLVRLDGGPDARAALDRATSSTRCEPSDELCGAAPVIEPGTQIGRYRIRARIGAGGVGVVYAAVDESLGREVALKLVRPGPRKPSRLERRRARLIREARALARLGHPNIVVVHEVGQLDEQVFVAMEFVEGVTVRAWLRERPRRWTEILEVFEQAGRGLAAAHAAGIVHRDFKPENLLLGRDGRVRVGDFGLATVVGDSASGSASGDGGRVSVQTSPEADAPRAESHAQVTSRELQVASSTSSSERAITSEGSSARITGHGKVLGTPAYMSPEQSRAEPVDARSDQYSFCVSLWEALAGERPQGPVDLRGPRGEAGPGSQAHPDLPRSVRRALARGLRVDPDDRFADMPALLDALAWRAAQRRRRVGLAIAAALGFGLALGLVLGATLVAAS